MTEAAAGQPPDWDGSRGPFLAAVLAALAQPVWVVDHGERVRFANPAALLALGYDSWSELDGRSSHSTIQYKYADGSAFPLEASVMLRPGRTGETILMHQDSLVRRDGSMVGVSLSSTPIQMGDGRGGVSMFHALEAEREIEREEHMKEVADARADEARAAQRRIIEAGDGARRRLARDLHDGAQQQLITSIMNLQIAQQKWSSDRSRAREHLDAGVQQAEAGRRALRELVAGIHPPILTQLGLSAAVEALAARMPLPVSLDLIERRLPRSVEASVYFFVSEALTNVIKHAHASDATIRIDVGDRGLIVEISDDGVGGADPAAGGGLAGLADRVEALGGVLTITSQALDGTTLHAQIPLSFVGPPPRAEPPL